MRILHVSLGTRLWLEGATHVTGNDVTRPGVTASELEVTLLTGSHLEVAVEGRKLLYTVSFTSYKAVAHRRRQSRDRK